MWNFKIGRSVGLMFQTLPFIALRTAVYFGCSLLLIAGWIGGPALGALLAPASFWRAGAWIGFGIGASASSVAVYFLREYFLYLVKAGHIAVLVELMEGRSLPKGKGQLAYAKDIVSNRFVEASAFFALDQIITGILGVVNKVLVGLGSFIPGMDGVMSIVGKVLRVSLTFADEVILALSFRTASTDVWRTSRDGVVLYAQNYKNILKNAFFLAILNYLLVIGFFLLAWGPAVWMANLMPGDASGIVVFIVALLLVYSLKKAVIEPLLMTALMQVYFQAIAGQMPNPAWVAKLEGISQKFAEMKSHFVGAEASGPQALYSQTSSPQASYQEAWYPQAHPQGSYPQAYPQGSYPQAYPQGSYQELPTAHEPVAVHAPAHPQQGPNTAESPPLARRTMAMGLVNPRS